MNGAAAPPPSTRSSPSARSAMMIGSSHHFLWVRMKSHSSPIIERCFCSALRAKSDLVVLMPSASELFEVAIGAHFRFLGDEIRRLPGALSLHRIKSERTRDQP